MIGLHVHTTFSFLDGFGTAEQYAQKLLELGIKTMAVTDHGNIYAHREFDKVFRQHGLKLIPGCEMYVDGGTEKYYHLTVLAATNNGYRNLCRLVSISNQPDHFNKRPCITWNELEEHRDGIIFLTGCFGDGYLHRAYQKDRESVLKKAKWMANKLGKVYIEIQHIDREERDFFRLVSKMAGIPLCPTIDTHYPNKEQYAAEDLMFCIGQKQRMADKSRYKLTDNLWLMSTKEALEHGFTQEEIDRTYEIGNNCNVELPSLRPVEIPDARSKLVEMVRANAKRLGDSIRNEVYRERYRYEMSVIDKLGLHAYFVVMGDVVHEFKTRGVCVGPARGSAGGSLIAYLTGITEVDPIRWGLSFERFLDINRKDFPDIDTDFPHNSTPQVVKFLGDRYGHDRIGRLCSFTTYRGGSVFWDIARAYGIDRELVKKLGKEVPKLVNDEIDMEQILELPGIKDACEHFPQFLMAQQIEGQVRQLGKHASGYVVSPVPLQDVVSFNRSGEESVLSVDKDRAEAMGLLKLDILSLSTLDMVQNILHDTGLKNTDLYRLEPDNREVYDAFNRGDVAGIFQFEGGAVRRALQTLKVTNLEDLAFINAVARPGASNALTGTIKVPDVFKPFIYKGKYFVYQEELMAILRFLNFDWESVTKFRKLVSKKKVTELRGLYFQKFVDEASKHMEKASAIEFWEVINRCGEYMFNKSHAIAYAMLAYWCMWLKMKYPAQFAIHYLNQTDDVKRREMLREYIRAGWHYMIYDPQRSQFGFTAIDGYIIGGLTAIKGIGPAKAKKVMEGKGDKGAMKAIGMAEKCPEVYAQWAALDDFPENRVKIGRLPQDEMIVRARVWEIKDGSCMIEDKWGSEKAYFNPLFVELEEGKVFDLCVSKYNYVKIDSARRVK